MRFYVQALKSVTFREKSQFLFVVRLLHKLGDADRRLTRQNRLRLTRTLLGPNDPRRWSTSRDYQVGPLPQRP